MYASVREFRTFPEAAAVIFSCITRMDLGTDGKSVLGNSNTLAVQRCHEGWHKSFCRIPKYVLCVKYEILCKICEICIICKTFICWSPRMALTECRVVLALPTPNRTRLACLVSIYREFVSSTHGMCACFWRRHHHNLIQKACNFSSSITEIPAILPILKALLALLLRECWVETLHEHLFNICINTLNMQSMNNMKDILKSTYYIHDGVTFSSNEIHQSRIHWA
jgi:hypothetical protein